MKCSKHRSTVVPPRSPQKMWSELDIVGPDPETQYLDEPLRTRAVIRKEREMRQQSRDEKSSKKCKTMIRDQATPCPVCDKMYTTEELVLHGPSCAERFFDDIN